MTRPVLDTRVAFRPRSVAVIGASANPGGHAGRALANLTKTGFPGSIHPINPKYDELLGHRCYPDIAAVEEPPEVAYVLLPAAKAVEAVRAAGRAGVRLAVVCSSGFSELGDAGQDLQLELGRIADETGIRVIGPNCIGIVSPVGQFVGAPTFNITYDQKPGSVALLSHSGGLGVTVFNRAQDMGTGFHSMVSLGNEADLTMGELIEALAEDDEVRTIALVVEQVRDPHRFRTAVRAARAAGKTLVALKNGRSAAGSAAVAGHTGALAGDHKVFSAVLRDLGVIEAATLDELVDTVHLVDRVPVERLGARVAVVSPSGGETVYVADRAGHFGVELPALEPTLAQRVQQWMPLGNPANPLDLTGQIIGDADLLSKVLQALGGQSDIDALMVCLATWGPYDAEAILSRVVAATADVTTPLIFTAWDAGAMTERVEEILEASGRPWFRSPDRALAALGLVSSLEASSEAPAIDRGLAVSRPQGGASLGEVEAAGVLAAAGLPMVEFAVAGDAAAAIAIAEKWDGQVVLKLNAPDVLHKSDLGLVEVDLPTLADVESAARRLLERADALDLSHAGVLVARKESGQEVIVGGLRDAAFGPFVLVGVGGVLAEFINDTVLVPAPATPASVRSALQRLRGWEVLRGVRGRSYDVDALVVLVARFSEILAANEWLGEVDLNPVIVRPISVGGAVAVDAVVVPCEEETS